VLDGIFQQKNNALSFGAAYNALTIIKLKQVRIPLPPLNVQDEIVSEIHNDIQAIERASTLKYKMQSKINSLIDNVWGR